MRLATKQLKGVLSLANGGTNATTAPLARTSLGLGGAAILNVGTVTSTVAAGDDSRIVNALSTSAAAATYTPLALIATGGNLARAPADRASDVINVLDVSGVDRTAGTDSSSAITNVQTYATSVNKNVVIPPGNYLLNSNVTMGANSSWELTNTKFSGTGLITNSGDWSALQPRLAKAWLKRENQPGNTFGTYNSMYVDSTSSSTSYEKAAGYDYITTSDPSAVGSVDRDAVARQMTASIFPGNMTGRIWAMVLQASVSSGADGSAAGAEIDIVNNGTDQPVQGTATSKTGMGIIAFGTNPVTTGMNFVKGSNTFYDGISIAQESVTRYAIRITSTGQVTTNTFHVTPTGDMLVNSLGTAGGKSIVLSNATSAVNYLVVQGSSTGNVVNLTTSGADSAVPLNISPTGAVYLGGTSINCNSGLYGSSATFSGSVIAVSPVFSGVPTTPTATAGTNTTQIASTAFVASAITAAAYVLPTATTSVLGGVKIDGTSVAIASGVISVTGTLVVPTGNNATITASGVDTNISTTMKAKGTGAVAFNNDNGILAFFSQQSTTTNVNYLLIQSSLTNNALAISATGSDTNINISINPKGTGLLQLNNVTANTITTAGNLNGAVVGITGNLGGALPTIVANGYIGWNYSSGNAEIDFFNNATGFPVSFSWYQIRTSLAPLKIMELSSTGVLTVTGSIFASTTRIPTFSTAGGVVIELVDQSNAVNHISVLGAGTGVSPQISTKGGDSTPALYLNPLGVLYLGGSAVQSLVSMFGSTLTLTSSISAVGASLTGTCTAPTVAANVNNTNIATTAYSTAKSFISSLIFG